MADDKRHKSDKWAAGSQRDTWARGLGDALKAIFKTVWISGWLAVAVSGIGLLCWQIYGWLKDGYWQSFSITSVLARYAQGSPAGDWAVSPTDWIGLHAILLHVPSSLVLFLIGLSMAVASSQE